MVNVDKKLFKGPTLVGKRFGRLVVFSCGGKKPKKGSFWNCICDCGKKVVRFKTELTNKYIHSCGCFNNERRKKGITGQHTLDSMYQRVLYFYQRNAKNRNIGFNLSLEQVKEIVNRNCHYCDSGPTNKIRYKDKTLNYNGIDRIDSSVGYELWNVTPCCYNCNIAKHKLTTREFSTWIMKAYKNYIETGRYCEYL